MNILAQVCANNDFMILFPMLLKAAALSCVGVWFVKLHMDNEKLREELLIALETDSN